MHSNPGSVLRQFGPMVYLPTILFSLGEGAILPLIPIFATAMGADVAFAALIASALVVGQLCGNLPAGWAVARVGERWTMVIAGAVSMLALVGMLAAPALGLFAAAVFLLGFCAAAFGLARHAFMTTRVPRAFRARSLSLLGGSFRLGIFLGPFVTAALLQVTGSAQAAIWFFLVCLVATVALVLFGPDPEATAMQGRTSQTTPLVRDVGGRPSGTVRERGEPHRSGVFPTMWHHRRVLATLGLAAASLSAVRSARQVVLPLWGLSIGLDAQAIALVVGVSGAIDFALFYASGQVMDRFGRIWAAMPAMVLMGAGFLALSLTHEQDAALLWFGMLAAVLGVGNGLSSGILLTLGADVAPPGDPAPFLGSWRTLTDAGGAVAPVIVAGVTAAASLSVASAVMGVIGLAGAYGFLRWVPRKPPSASTAP